jgi:hypothetical protein
MGRGGRGSGREGRREGRGAHLGDPTPAITVSKTYGTTGRERWEGERLLRGRNQMREKGPGVRAWGAGGARGARAELGQARLGQVGLGRTAGQNPVARNNPVGWAAPRAELGQAGLGRTTGSGWVELLHPWGTRLDRVESFGSLM